MNLTQNDKNSIKIVTIAIPTINRCEQLKKTLLNIYTQLEGKKLLSKINILILDSNSNDRTKEYVNVLLSKYNNINYYNETEKKGFDYCFLKSIELSNSKYIWICNDHSGFIENTFERIINILEKNIYSYIYAPEKSFKSIKFKEDTKIHAFQGMLMNSNIYKKEDFLPFYKKFVQKYKDSFLTFYISQMYMVFSGYNCYTLQFKCIDYGKFVDKSRSNNSWSTNYKSYIRTGYYLAIILEEIKKEFNLNELYLNNILKNNKKGFSAILVYLKLILKNKKENYESLSKAKIIASPILYNNLIRFLLIKIISGNNIYIYIINYFLLIPINIVIKIKKQYLGLK